MPSAMRLIAVHTTVFFIFFVLASISAEDDDTIAFGKPNPLVATARRLELSEEKPKEYPSSKESKDGQGNELFVWRLKDPGILDRISDILSEESNTASSGEIVDFPGPLSSQKASLFDEMADVSRGASHTTEINDSQSENKEKNDKSNLTKKFGFLEMDAAAFTDSFQADDPKNQTRKNSDQHALFSQVFETRVAAPDIEDESGDEPELEIVSCEEGMEGCLPLNETLQLREQLLDDMESAINSPLSSKIQFRLKKRPSVYTTKKPSLPEIGIPDIYETEVEVTVSEDTNNFTPEPAYNVTDNLNVATSYSTFHISKDPADVSKPESFNDIQPSVHFVALEAITAQSKENNDIHTFPDSGLPVIIKRKPDDIMQRRTDGVKRPLGKRKRPRNRPDRIGMKKHLDYRRPIAFKYTRVRNPDNSEEFNPSDDTSKEDDSNENYESDTKYFPSNKKRPHVPDYHETPHKENSNYKQGRPFRKRPGKKRKKNKKRPPLPPPVFLPPNYKHPDEYSKPVESYEVPESHSHESYPTHHQDNNKVSYNAVASTEPSVLYSTPAQSYIAPERDHVIAPTHYENPDQNHDYFTPSKHPFSQPGGVPGWLMDIKAENHEFIIKSKPNLHPTPPPGYHPKHAHREEHRPIKHDLPNYVIPGRRRPKPPELIYSVPIRTYKLPHKEFDNKPSLPDQKRQKNPLTVKPVYNPPPPQLQEPLKFHHLQPEKGHKPFIKTQSLRFEQPHLNYQVTARPSYTTIIAQIPHPTTPRLPLNYVPPSQEHSAPHPKIRPAAFYETPKHEYIPPQSERKPSIQYETPKHEYVPPKKVTHLIQSYELPHKEYENPKQIYEKPIQIYETPKQEYSLPKQAYESPHKHSKQKYEILYQEQIKHISPPVRDYIAPHKEHLVPPLSYTLPKQNKHSEPVKTYSLPKQNYELPNNEYAPPKVSLVQAYVPPKQEYAPPKQEYIPPEQDYVPPKQAYVPPKQAYVPPKQEYIPSKQEYEILTKEYAPPKQEYVPPKQEYVPPKQEYEIPIKEFVPPKQEYVPPKEHYSPPEHNYKPSQIKHSAAKPEHSIPEQHYSLPKLHHPKIEQLYSPPKYEYSPQSHKVIEHQRYSPPKNEYNVPEQHYAVPKQEYELPRPYYSQPPQSYSLPENEYLIPDPEPPPSEYRLPDGKYSLPGKPIHANVKDEYVPPLPPQSPNPVYATVTSVAYVSPLTPAPSYRAQPSSYTHKPKHPVHATTYQPVKNTYPLPHSYSFMSTGIPLISIKHGNYSSTYRPPVYTPVTYQPTYKELKIKQKPVEAKYKIIPKPQYDDDYYYYYDDDDDEYYDDYYLHYDDKKPLVPHSNLIHEEDFLYYGYIAGIPGRAGIDYPILSYIPLTSFGCGLVADYPGYYADMEAGCQVFHVCHQDGRQDSFLCPNGTIFNQKYFVCDWWYNFACEDAPFFYPVNAAIGHPGVPLHKTIYEPDYYYYYYPEDYEYESKTYTAYHGPASQDQHPSASNGEAVEPQS